MASLEQRGSGWRIVFMWKGMPKSFTLGDVSAVDAAAHKADAETRLKHLKQGLLDLRGHTIETYPLHKGHPPKIVPEQVKPKEEFTLARLKDN
jgi:hypothetical protein